MGMYGISAFFFCEECFVLCVRRAGGREGEREKEREREERERRGEEGGRARDQLRNLECTHVHVHVDEH